ncbi:MAG: complex I NDUFA9 subunit family protein, partial [Proteobacteria bacterium]|nr:complex I NDUFA9 subunit family protein [Pseudomonadota bacterium]
MSSKNYSRTIGIFGASGFIGESIIQRLARNNYKIKVASRNPYLSQNLRVSGDTAQIELTKINIHSDKSIQNFLDDCDVCINLIGILYEKSSQKFEDIHFKFPNTLSKIFSSSRHSKLLIHFSALGAKANSNSKYISSKYAGEEAIKKNFSNYAIIRPSIVIGPKDNFFNMFAKLVNIFPVIPLVGAETKFQPVYVNDIAEAVNVIIENNLSKQIFELGGPKIFSFLELIKMLLTEIRKKRIIIPIPFSMGKIQAFFLQMFPKPLLTLDQVQILQEGDNIVSDQNKTFIKWYCQDYYYEKSVDGMSPEAVHEAIEEAADILKKAGGANVFIGKNSQPNSSGVTNEIVIGANVGGVLGSSTVTIGSTAIGRIYNNYSSNATWTRTSDERYKTQIEPLQNALDK